MNNGQKTIYLAGQVTGIPYERAVMNFDRGVRLAKALNYKVLNPLGIVPPTATRRQAMTILLPLFNEQCDAILMLRDYMFSEGAKIELQLARYYDMPVLFEDDLN